MWLTRKKKSVNRAARGSPRRRRCARTMADEAAPSAVAVQLGEPLPCAFSPCNRYRILATPMLGFVAGLVGASYAPYVLWSEHPTVWSWFCVVVFHVLLANLLCAYIHCVLTDPGTVPPEWHERVAADARLAARTRLCTKSRLYRPPRSHYCSVTQRVVLNMCAAAARARRRPRARAAADATFHLRFSRLKRRVMMKWSA